MLVFDEVMTSRLSPGGLQHAVNQSARELLFLDLPERDFYPARRGMIALSLAVSDEEPAGFRDALEEVLSSRAALLRATAG